MKFWLTGVTYKGNYNHLKELIDPIKNQFDGLIWTFHDAETAFGDSGLSYLEENKKDGEIIYAKWCQRLDYSRNHTLFQGPMEYGDWFIVVDTLERLTPVFVGSLKNLTLQERMFDGIYLDGKRLMARFDEGVKYQGNPHEGLFGLNHPVNVLINDIRADLNDDCFWNVRNEHRDEFHWIGAYMRYYFFPDTNHLLLGYERNQEYVKHRYFIRGLLKKWCLENNVEFSVNGLLGFVSVCDQLPERLVEIFNQEKILCDWYRYTFLNDKDLIDRHDSKYIKKI